MSPRILTSDCAKADPLRLVYCACTQTPRNLLPSATCQHCRGTGTVAAGYANLLHWPMLAAECPQCLAEIPTFAPGQPCHECGHVQTQPSVLEHINLSLDAARDLADSPSVRGVVVLVLRDEGQSVAITTLPSAETVHALIDSLRMLLLDSPPDEGGDGDEDEDGEDGEDGEDEPEGCTGDCANCTLHDNGYGDPPHADFDDNGQPHIN